MSARIISTLPLDSCLYTFGWTIFLLPYQIVTGGVTGMAAVIYYGTGDTYLFVIFCHQCRLVACRTEDTWDFKFMVKTIYAIIMLSVLLAVAQDWMIGDQMAS